MVLGETFDERQKQWQEFLIPWIKLEKHSFQMDDLLQKIKEREERIARLAPNLLKAINFKKFIGLESKAVIAVLPLVSRDRTPKEHHEKFARIVYSMATRARALLAIVGEPEAISLLSQLRSQSKTSI